MAKGQFKSKRYGDVQEGMSYREIGLILGISHTHVKWIERRALNKLQVKFKEIIALEQGENFNK